MTTPEERQKAHELLDRVLNAKNELLNARQVYIDLKNRLWNLISIDWKAGK